MLAELAKVAVVLTAINSPVAPVPTTQVHCLAETVYYEARGVSVDNQIAVANVVMNRVRSAGASICAVVHDRHQFSWVTDVKRGKQLRKKLEGEAWDQAVEIAALVATGLINDNTRGATHFHHADTRPAWGKKLSVTARSKTFVFLREEPKVGRNT